MEDSRAFGKALSRMPSICCESAAGLINTSSHRRFDAGFISTQSCSSKCLQSWNTAPAIYNYEMCRINKPFSIQVKS